MRAKIKEMANKAKEKRLAKTFLRRRRAAKVASAIMSTLTLQNTLIYVFGGGDDENLAALVFVSTIALLVLQSAYSIVSLISGVRFKKAQNPSNF